MDQTESVSQTIILSIAALLLAVLGYTVNSIISPFVLVGAILYLLFPYRQIAFARRFLWLSVGVFLIWFVYSLIGLLTPFIVAFLLAYILNPFVARIERRGIPRWGSSLAVVVVMIGLAVMVILFVIPPAAQQFQGLIGSVAGIARDVGDLLKSGKLFEVLASYGIDVAKAQAFIGEQLSPGLETILTSLFQALFGFVTSVSSLLLHLINIVIIPFLFFYMLKDFPVIVRRSVAFVPEARRDRIVAFGRKVDGILGQYFRGAIVVAIIQGTIATIGLTIIGVDYALVLGIMTGILDFIPYVGLLISLTVSCIVALLSGEPLLIKVFAVIILFLSQKLLEAVVLAPKIIGAKVGLHPVILILSLLVFGYFLGLVGMLIAVPLTALMVTMLDEWENRREVIPRTGEV